MIDPHIDNLNDHDHDAIIKMLPTFSLQAPLHRPKWSIHRTVAKFLVNFSLFLHTCSKFVSLRVDSLTTGNFFHSINRKSSILCHYRCYRLQPLMTAQIHLFYLPVLFEEIFL